MKNEQNIKIKNLNLSQEQIEKHKDFQSLMDRRTEYLEQKSVRGTALKWAATTIGIAAIVGASLWFSSLYRNMENTKMLSVNIEEKDQLNWNKKEQALNPPAPKKSAPTETITSAFSKS